MLRRRDLLHLGAAGLGLGALPLAAGACAGAYTGPLDAARVRTRLEAAGFPWLGLVTSLRKEYDYAARVEGRLPARLRGSLYCNGPGLFERGGQRKRAVLDGDGMIRCFDFTDAGVRFRNRYVRTAKLVEEEAAGAYRRATWTTQAPGGRLANLFGWSLGNQAGVSVHPWRGALYAFDESFPPYALDPRTLETLGPSHLCLPDGEEAVFAAHPKRDGRTGEWVHFGLAYGREITVWVTGLRPDGTLAFRHAFPLPRYAYVHDWFVTERWVVLNVHPATIDVADFVLGRTSLVGAMRWEPELGNRLVVVPRRGGAAPLELETDTHFMWHALNAWERGGEIVADCVAHEGPRAFLGDDAVVFAVMEGRAGARSTGRLLRLVIDPAARRVRSEEVSAANHELPVVAPQRACHRHRFGYFTRGEGQIFWSRLARVDMESGREDLYDFGPGRYCLEPVFVPDPGGDGPEPGWLLSVVHDGATGRAELAVLRADRLADGPLARVLLSHHLPMSFHGAWLPAA